MSGLAERSNKTGREAQSRKLTSILLLDRSNAPWHKSNFIKESRGKLREDPHSQAAPPFAHPSCPRVCPYPHLRCLTRPTQHNGINIIVESRPQFVIASARRFSARLP